MLNAVADGGLHRARGQLAVPFVVEIRGRGRRGCRNGGVARNGRRRRHVVERWDRAGVQIDAPELLDQLEHIAGGLPAHLAGHPAGEWVKWVFSIRLRTAAFEQLREPALQKRLGLPARERLEPHRERAEAFDAVADGAVDAFGDRIVERGQHREGDAQRRQRFGEQRAAAEQVAQPRLPALDAALLQLVEGKHERAARGADDIHQRVDMGARDMIALGLREPHAADADVDRLAAKIGEGVVVAGARAKQGRDERFGRNRKVRQLLQPRADRDDQRAQVEIADVAAFAENVLLEGLGEIGLALGNDGAREPGQRRRRAGGHEIALRKPRNQRAQEPGVEVLLGHEVHHGEQRGIDAALLVHVADGGQERVGFSGAGRALDEKHAKGRVRVLPQSLGGDGIQRLAGLGLDAGHVQALLVGRARKRGHRAKDPIEFRAFKSLEP